MRIGRKLAALAVSAAMIVSAVPVTAFADDKAPERISVQIGEISFLGSMNMPYYYSDNYFAHSGKEEDEHLRTLSVILSAATGDAGTVSGLLTEVGFCKDDVAVEDYDKTPTVDTIGTVIAHKDGDPKILAVVVRGIGYGAEWGSNLTAGASGDTAGFAAAAAKVVARIKDYEQKNGVSGAKIWITGYSRAGTVADLTGKYINEHLDEFDITADDLYDYTFEAPRASATETKYENIHNVLNPNDIVPQVYPKAWGIYTSGHDDILPVPDGKVQPKVLNVFGLKIEDEKLSGEPVDPVSMTEFEESFLALLTNSITRDEYAAAETYAVPLILTAFTLNSEQMAALLEMVKAAFQGSLQELLTNLAPLFSTPKGTPEYEQYITALAQTLSDALDQQDHSACLTDEQYAAAKQAIPSLLRLAIPVLVSDLTSSFATIATFAGNASAIIDHHRPENVIPVIAQLDSYYTKKNEIKRGYAKFIFTVPDEETLYDDEALKKIGFNDTDIEYLTRGFDVVYKGEFLPYGDTPSYDKLPAEDPAKELIAKYAEENGIDLSFTTLGVLKLTRTRGFEEPEDVSVPFDATLLLDETEEKNLPADRVKLFYVDTKNNKVTEMDSECVFSEKYGHMVVKAPLSQEGIYMLANKALPKEEPPKDDDSSPKTGAAVPVTIMIAASPVLLMASKRRKH